MPKLITVDEMFNIAEEEARQAEATMTTKQKLARHNREQAVRRRDAARETRNEQHERDHPEMYGDEDDEEDEG